MAGIMAMGGGDAEEWVGIEGMGGKERKLSMVKERCCDWKKMRIFANWNFQLNSGTRSAISSGRSDIERSWRNGLQIRGVRQCHPALLTPTRGRSRRGMET
jgi:hypothetical protein